MALQKYEILAVNEGISSQKTNQLHDFHNMDTICDILKHSQISHANQHMK